MYFTQDLDMDTVQYVRKTDLARNTRRVIRDVQRGQMAVVESHGQPEVAIMDIVDYRIQRAFIHYYAQNPTVSPDDNVSDQVFASLTDEQEHTKRVIAYYLADLISLSRAAELIEVPAFDLRLRFARLGIPLRVGPQTTDEALQDMQNALNFTEKSRS
jgi:predicted HTH domain antitoxin